jgi:hypothetical protein
MCLCVVLCCVVLCCVVLCCVVLCCVVLCCVVLCCVALVFPTFFEKVQPQFRRKDVKTDAAVSSETFIRT